MINFINFLAVFVKESLWYKHFVHFKHNYHISMKVATYTSNIFNIAGCIAIKIPCRIKEINKSTYSELFL